MEQLSIEEKEGEFIATYKTHDVSLFELIVDKLNKEKGIEAIYQKPHPLVPRIVLKIKGKNPRKILEKIIKKLEKEFK